MLHAVLSLSIVGVLIGCTAEDSTSLSSDLDEAEESFVNHGTAELRSNPSVSSLAFGTTDAKKLTRHPWPVQVKSIGHTNASYQGYGGTPYFHHGLDIRADDGTEVIAAAGGQVVNIENYMPGDPAYWEVAILDDEGYLWQYHHVDRDSIPREIFDAYESKESIPTGTKIGEVYTWDVETFGETFHHIHLNVLGADQKYLSPFDFLHDLADDQAPEIVEIGLLKSGRRHNGNSVSGSYTIFATVHDLIQHDKFVVPPHLLTYRLNENPPLVVWHFADLPGGASREEYVRKFYVPSLTCGNYSCRKLTIDLGFSKSGNRSFPLTTGSHKIELTATDYAGNSVSQEFRWQVE